MRNLFKFSFAIFFLIASAAYGGQDFSVIEYKGKGVINWTERTVTAKGYAVPDEKTTLSHRQERLLEMAKLNAIDNLFKTISTIGLDSKSTAGELILASEALLEQVRSMVNNASILKKEYLTDGSVETTLQLSFDGGFAQLLLPEEIKQIEPVKTLNTKKDSGLTNENHQLNTGLVVDARGLNLKPVMSPKLIDESGREVYGPAFISREYAVQYGASEYTKNFNTIANHERTGPTPIVVTGLKASGKTPSDIVISNADAAKIHGLSTNLDFLNKCRVVIVISSKDPVKK